MNNKYELILGERFSLYDDYISTVISKIKPDNEYHTTALYKIFMDERIRSGITGMNIFSITIGLKNGSSGINDLRVNDRYVDSVVENYYFSAEGNDIVIDLSFQHTNGSFLSVYRKTDTIDMKVNRYFISTEYMRVYDFPCVPKSALRILGVEEHSDYYDAIVASCITTAMYESPYYLFAISNGGNNVIYVGDLVDLEKVDFDNAYLETVDSLIAEFKSSRVWADGDIEFFYYINRKEMVLRIINSKGRFESDSAVIPLDPNAIDW